MTDRGGNALLRAGVVCAVLQIVLVVVGHFSPPVLQMVAILGTLLSLVCGVLYVRWAGPGALGRSIWGAALAGGGGALVGIAVSVMLRDTPVPVLALGTLISAVGGGIGGAGAHVMSGRRQAI